MRRVIPILALLSSQVFAGSQAVISKHRASAPATANLLNETFTNVVGGYSSSGWTEPGSGGTADEDAEAADGCGTGTGWAGDCLKISLPSNFDAQKATNAFSAQTGDLWFHGRLKDDYTIGTDAEAGAVAVGVVALSDSVAAFGQGGMDVRILRVSSIDYRIRVFGGSVGTLVDFTYTTGSQICLELHMNNTSGAWGVWVGGSLVAEHAYSGAWAVSGGVTNLYLGATVTQPTGASQTQYWDEVQISTEGRLECL